MFHIFNYLLTYCNENYDQCDEVKELTNEVYNYIQNKINLKIII